MGKLVDKYETIFLEKRGKRWNCSKTFSLYLSLLSNGFEACQKAKLNLTTLERKTPVFKTPKLVEEYKTIYLRKQGKRWNSSKTFSLYLGFL